MTDGVILISFIILFIIAIELTCRCDKLEKNISYLEVRVAYLENIVSLDNTKE